MHQLSSVIVLLLSTLLLTTIIVTKAATTTTVPSQLNAATAAAAATVNVDETISQIFHKDEESSALAALYDDIDVYVPYRSDSHDQFSWAFLQRVLKEGSDDSDGNVIVSPFSVQLVLALLAEAAGTDTDTQKQLRSTLTDIKSPDNLRGYYKKTLTALKLKSPHFVLNLETKLYTDAHIVPQQRYLSTLHRFYDTEIEMLDFSAAKAAADTINLWCKNVTHGRLEQIVTADNIENKALVMANVIYFNGLWRSQFNETFEGVFFAPDKTTTSANGAPTTKQLKVDYMKQTEYFYYYDSMELDAKILRLPYRGKQFSMFIALPKSKTGIDELIKTLDNSQLKRTQWMMEEQKVIVTLPKFSFEFNKSLKQTLIAMGIEDIFTDNASLPGLARGVDKTKKLKVSDIFQKAGIEVNERGTEAYASTVVEIENKFGGSTTVEEFHANRPFIFFIEEESSGNLIFAGKVLTPHN